MAEKNKTEEYDVIVIGGGASGMMAAGIASRDGKRVLLVEKNRELGKKLKITGGGRCNITNATYDTKELLSKFGKAEPFLYSPFSQFGVKDTFKFFETKRLPLVIEEKNRVFPKSQKAMDVFDVLYKFITQKEVIVMLTNPVSKINMDPSTKKITSIETKKGVFSAKNYIIATGGTSHPETGSTGDGFKWLKELGHTANDPTPTIVPLKVSDAWVKKLTGKSVKEMKITFYINGKKSFSDKGNLLFTHFGISGPTILNLAHKVTDLLHEGAVTAVVDFYPSLDIGALDKKILESFDSNKNKLFKNILKEIVPEGMTDLIINSGIVPDPSTPIHLVSKEQRRQIVDLLKGKSMTITGLMGMDRAVISDGGIPLEEVDTRTMKSRIIKNLYFTGDILHINRPSGGYSLQLCWTTAYVAGQIK